MKKKPIREADPEQAMRSRDEQLKNNDKMTKNLFYEFERLQKRYERISDPIYPGELRRKA